MEVSKLVANSSRVATLDLSASPISSSALKRSTFLLRVFNSFMSFFTRLQLFVTLDSLTEIDFLKVYHPLIIFQYPIFSLSLSSNSCLSVLPSDTSSSASISNTPEVALYFPRILPSVILTIAKV